MKYYKTNWGIPYYNLAFEEYLMTQMPNDDYFFFYINDPSIIVGKFQNTLEEVNLEYVEENGIYVARRLTGGGAVYHDAGNLNFSFVVRAKAKEVNNFEKFTSPIIKALRTMGVPAELSGRNDVLVDGKKISGNAQYGKNNMIISHGTLLFDSAMENLSKALNPKELKINSKGVKSVKSRVTNIKPYMQEDLSILEFKNRILEYLSETETLTEEDLTQEDINWVEQAVENKFGTWEWNWGKSPAFDIRREERFPCGIIDARIRISKGLIEECKFYGDFFVKKDIEILEEKLKGVAYKASAVLETISGSPAEAIHTTSIDDFFHGMSATEFVTFFCPS